MAKTPKFSDISSADESEVDNDSNARTDILKLFDSETEMDQSFSGFEKEASNSASNPTANVKPLGSRRGRGENNGPGKGPGKNLKKKSTRKT